MQKRFIPGLRGCRCSCVLRVFLAAGLLLIGLFAGPVVAGPPAESSPAEASGKTGAGEPRRAKDPVPDPVPRTSNEAIVENPFLRHALSRSHEGLEAIRKPDGTLTLDLENRFQNVTTATIGADGGIEMRCGHGHESLAAFRAAHPEAEPPGSGPARVGEGGDEPQ